MRAVCAEAAARGVAVGAQVSYADRANFGRVALDVAYELLRDQVADQVGTLSSLAVEEGTTVRYLKPHGALYHRVLDDEEQARAVLDGSGSLPVLGMPGLLLTFAGEAGRRVFHEGFPDRGYTPAGRLVPRGEDGALVTDEDGIVAQALDLADRVDSLCLHGDSPGAVDHARAVRRALERSGRELAPFA
jgi:5-oxoprolinase (ATP-hydrolysing) subunit A